MYIYIYIYVYDVPMSLFSLYDPSVLSQAYSRLQRHLSKCSPLLHYNLYVYKVTSFVFSQDSLILLGSNLVHSLSVLGTLISVPSTALVLLFPFNVLYNSTSIRKCRHCRISQLRIFRYWSFDPSVHCTTDSL